MKIAAITTSRPVSAIFMPRAPGWTGLKRDKGAVTAVIAATLAAPRPMSLRRKGSRRVRSRVAHLIGQQAFAQPRAEPFLEAIGKAEAGRDDQQSQQSRQDEAADDDRAHRRPPGRIARQRDGGRNHA